MGRCSKVEEIFTDEYYRSVHNSLYRPIISTMNLYVAKYLYTDDCTYAYTTKEIFIAENDDEAHLIAESINKDNLEDIEKLDQLGGYKIILQPIKS